MNCFFFLSNQTNKNDIVITGDQNSINAAKERIYEIYHDKKLNCEAIPIVIKKCQHKYIIGQKGSVLNEIFKTTGVSIEMPTGNLKLKKIMNEIKMTKSIIFIYFRSRI